MDQYERLSAQMSSVQTSRRVTSNRVVNIVKKILGPLSAEWSVHLLPTSAFDAFLEFLR